MLDRWSLGSYVLVSCHVISCLVVPRTGSGFFGVGGVLAVLLAVLRLAERAGYLQQKGVSGSTRTVYEEACSEMDTINE